MNGPEHYQEAERLLDEAASPDFVGYGRENALAAAQAHATLALVAVHVGDVATDLLHDKAWQEATS